MPHLHLKRQAKVKHADAFDIKVEKCLLTISQSLPLIFLTVSSKSKITIISFGNLMPLECTVFKMQFVDKFLYGFL